MAAGHGHVYHIKPRGEYYTDNDASSPGLVHIAGVWAGLQLDMRYLDIRRALYTLVIRGNFTGCERSYSDCNIWSNSGAGA